MKNKLKFLLRRRISEAAYKSFVLSGVCIYLTGIILFLNFTDVVIRFNTNDVCYFVMAVLFLTFDFIIAETRYTKISAICLVVICCLMTTGTKIIKLCSKTYLDMTLWLFIALMTICLFIIFLGHRKGKKRNWFDDLTLWWSTFKHCIVIALISSAVILLLVGIGKNVVQSCVRPSVQATSSFSIIEIEDDAEFRETIKDLDNGTWKELSMKKKVDILQTVLNYECAKNHIEPVKFRVGAYSDTFYSYKYNDKKSELSLSPDIVFEWKTFERALYHMLEGLADSHEEIKTNSASYAFDTLYELKHLALRFCIEDGEAVLSEEYNLQFPVRIAIFDRTIKLYVEDALNRNQGIDCDVFYFENTFTDKGFMVSSIKVYDMNEDKNNDFFITDADGTVYQFICNSDGISYTLTEKKEDSTMQSPPVETEIDIEFNGTNWEENPIDEFVNKFKIPEDASNLEKSEYEYALMKAWESEVTNGYSILASSANTPVVANDVDSTLNSFMAYVDGTAEIEAMTYFSNAFVSEDTSCTDLSAGTALDGAELMIKKEMYREEALRIYSLLELIYEYESIDEVFVFDEEKFMAMLEKPME